MTGQTREGKTGRGRGRDRRDSSKGSLLRLKSPKMSLTWNRTTKKNEEEHA